MLLVAVLLPVVVRWLGRGAPEAIGVSSRSVDARLEPLDCTHTHKQQQQQQAEGAREREQQHTYSLTHYTTSAAQASPRLAITVLATGHSQDW